MSLRTQGLVRSPLRLGWWSWLVLAALPAQPGCLGGQTGTEQRSDPGETASGGGLCEEVATVVSEDDDSLGFAAADVFGFVLGSHETSLGWQAPSDDASFGPESGTSPLVVGITRAGGLTKVHSVPRTAGGEGGPTIGIGCPGPRLEAEVSVRLQSAGGALDETLPGVLRISDAQSAELAVTVKLDQLSGSFSVVPAAGGKLETLGIRARFTALGHAGVLTGSLEVSRDGAASQRGVLFGRWPADTPCTTGFEPVVAAPLDLPAAEVLAGALAQLRRASALALRWDSGGSTELALEPTAGETACLVALAPGLEPLFVLPLALGVRTSDGRVETTLVGELSQAPGASSADLRVGRQCPGETPALQAEACGLGEVELGDRHSLSVSLSAAIRADSAPTGSLQVLGITPLLCEPTPMSSCGSRGAEPIDTGRF